MSKFSIKPHKVGIIDWQSDDSRDWAVAFEQCLRQRLGSRADSIEAIIAYLLKQKRPLTIVETGCLRDVGNWAGDGQSTFIWDWVVSLTGGTVWSVDISPQNVAAARSVTSNNVQLVLGDSVSFLSCFKGPIDLLYLDSFDLDPDNPMPAARHHMNELTAAKRNLWPESIVMVDDTEPGKGKGLLIADYMAAVGSKQIIDGKKQAAWLIG